MQKNLLAVGVEQPVYCKKGLVLIADDSWLMLINRQSNVMVLNTNSICFLLLNEGFGTAGYATPWSYTVGRKQHPAV